jgi:Glycosyl transferases group 1
VKRVVVIAYEGHPSTRLRISQYRDHLARDGFAMELVLLPQGGWRESARRFPAVKTAIRDADVVFVQRVLQKWLNFLLRSASKPVVFDLDDSVYLIRLSQLAATERPESPEDRARVFYRRLIRGSEYYSSRKRVLDDMLGFCRAAVVGSPIIAQDLAAVARCPVLVLPTSVPVKPARVKQPEDGSRAVRLCWVGTKGGLPYLQSLEPAFRKLRERFGDAVILRVITSVPFHSPSLPTEFVPWSLDKEEELIRESDIGIMPLVAEPFARGKCSFKAILCMSYGIPVVISPVGMNKHLVEHGWDGFLASTPQEWETSIATLVLDVNLRTTMGLRAHEKIATEYSVQRTYPRLRDVLINAADGATPGDEDGGTRTGAGKHRTFGSGNEGHLRRA